MYINALKNNWRDVFANVSRRVPLFKKSLLLNLISQTYEVG